MTSVSDEGEGLGTGAAGGLDVSRSGRVRKKNSLLAAYESLDEVEKPKMPKKKGEKVKKGSASVHKVTLSLKGGGHKKDKKSSSLGNMRMKMTMSNSSKKGPSRGSFMGDGDLEMDLPPEYDDDVMPSLGLAAEESHGYSSSDIDDRTNGHGHGHGHGRGPVSKLKSQAQSTYMMEKEKPFVAFKNRKSAGGSGGGVGKTKEVKKDKGQGQGPRVTAYTLWAKDQREFISKKYPHLDASSLSRKLSEVWQTSIPPNQRKLWKNKADKIMRKNLNIKNSAPIIPPPGKGKRRGRPRIHPLPTDSDSFNGSGNAAINPPTKMIRKVGNFKTGKQRTLADSSKPAGKRLSTPKSVTSNGIGLSPTDKTSHQYQMNHYSAASPSMSLFSATKQLSPRKDDDFVYKVTGTAPLDVAAHFALLGESLSIIGERLMDVERQPVSGSLSVLMDSLLCAITPLVCLTQQVPELNCIPQDRLTRLLDHIAYIMPGL